MSSADFFAPALPAQLFLFQHRCFFAPVFLVHSLAVWVALVLQNMPPKAYAPEARMVFKWDQVSGVEFCIFSGPSRCLPIVCISSCCIFSPDQGRPTATYHQFKVRMYGIELLSPAHSFTHASMLPLPAPRLGKIHDACSTLQWGAQLES